MRWFTLTLAALTVTAVAACASPGSAPLPDPGASAGGTGTTAPTESQVPATGSVAVGAWPEFVDAMLRQQTSGDNCAALFGTPAEIVAGAPTVTGQLAWTVPKPTEVPLHCVLTRDGHDFVDVAFGEAHQLGWDDPVAIQTARDKRDGWRKMGTALVWLQAGRYIFWSGPGDLGETQEVIAAGQVITQHSVDAVFASLDDSVAPVLPGTGGPWVVNHRLTEAEASDLIGTSLVTGGDAQDSAYSFHTQDGERGYGYLSVVTAGQDIGAARTQSETLNKALNTTYTDEPQLGGGAFAATDHRFRNTYCSLVVPTATGSLSVSVIKVGSTEAVCGLASTTLAKVATQS